MNDISDFDKEVCWKHPENGASSSEVDATIVTTHYQGKDFQLERQYFITSIIKNR